MTFKVLGIETSCDETAAAVVADGSSVLSNVVSSQVDVHRKFGGVVPEVASRRHVEMLLPVVQEALDAAALTIEGIDGIAVTSGPGLAGALLVGVSFAKALAFARRLPLIGVNHLEGHVHANWLGGNSPAFPFVCLVASGGHTDLVLVRGHCDMEIVGRTRDDAAGEAFDKAARAMGLGYPGGPLIDKLARNGRPGRVRLPRAYLEEGSFDFSFSGIKTAVVLAMERVSSADWGVEDLAAEFQEAVAEVLVDKAVGLALDQGIRRVAVAGGVAANTALRRRLANAGLRWGLETIIPPTDLCTDNAAMIAAAGYHRLQAGERAGLDLNAEADQPLGAGGYCRSGS